MPRDTNRIIVLCTLWTIIFLEYLAIHDCHRDTDQFERAM